MCSAIADKRSLKSLAAENDWIPDLNRWWASRDVPRIAQVESNVENPKSSTGLPSCW